MLFDGPWIEHDDRTSSRPIARFTDTKPYQARLKASIEATGLKDAVIVGSGTIDGIATVVASMDALHRRQHGGCRRRKDYARDRAGDRIGLPGRDRVLLGGARMMEARCR
jgi:hypothetical protein